MSRRRKSGRSGGFTLLEVLVALAIVAVAAVGILTLSKDLGRLVGTSRVDAMALLTYEVAYKYNLDQRVTNMRDANLKGPVNLAGSCDPPYDDCTWAIRTEQVPEEPGLALMRLTVECGDESVTIERAITGPGGPQ